MINRGIVAIATMLLEAERSHIRWRVMFRNEYGMRRSCIAQRRWYFFRLLFNFTCSRGDVAPSGGGPGDWIWRHHDWLYRTDSSRWSWNRFEVRVCVLILFTKKVMKMNTKSKPKVPSRTSKSGPRCDHRSNRNRTSENRIWGVACKINNSQLQEPSAEATATVRCWLSHVRLKQKWPSTIGLR